MATLLLYRKLRETKTEVEYSHGPSPQQQDGRLILDAQDPTAEPSSGADTPSGKKVAAKLLWLRQENPVWPQHGAIQS